MGGRFDFGGGGGGEVQRCTRRYRQNDDWDDWDWHESEWGQWWRGSDDGWGWRSDDGWDEFRFLSKQDFLHSCYVDVLDFPYMKVSHQSTIKQFQRTFGSKKTAQPHFHISLPRFWGRCFWPRPWAHFPPRHANGLNELPLRGVIIPGIPTTQGPPSRPEQFWGVFIHRLPDLNRTWNYLLDANRFFRICWHGGSRDVGFRV